jgi:CheY-like chemotaxis protein
MFIQIDRSLAKSQGGLGIGLTLVKRLLEMHGGSIEARSDGLGTGCEFVVRLPVVIAAPPRRHGEGKAAPPASDAARQRILVVDDNRDSAVTLAKVLALLGNAVETAHDGVEALAIAERFRPQVVLLDIGMPRLNGYETCRLLRERPWARGTTIVALTGWGQDEDRQRSHDAGFDDHLVKPVDANDLAALLRRRAAASVD